MCLFFLWFKILFVTEIFILNNSIRFCLGVCLTLISILNTKITHPGRFYFLYFTKEKWGLEVLRDLPKASLVTGDRVNIEARPTAPELELLALHYPSPSCLSVPEHSVWAEIGRKSFMLAPLCWEHMHG